MKLTSVKEFINEHYRVDEDDNKKTLLSFWNSSAEVLKLLDDEDNKKMKDCLKDIDKIISKIK